MSERSGTSEGSGKMSTRSYQQKNEFDRKAIYSGGKTGDEINEMLEIKSKMEKKIAIFREKRKSRKL